MIEGDEIDISASRDPHALRVPTTKVGLEAVSFGSPSRRSTPSSSTLGTRDTNGLADQMRRERSRSAPPTSEDSGEIYFCGSKNQNPVTGNPRLYNSWHRSRSFQSELMASTKPNQVFSRAGQSEPQSGLGPSPPNFSPLPTSSTRVSASVFDDRDTDLSLNVDSSGQ